MKIGIVGSGMIVNSCLQTLKQIDNISISAICVREPKREYAMALSKEYNIKNIYTNYEDMLDDEDVDIVYIGIINSLHYKYTKIALKKGKHVIVEKPFTSTYEEARELVEIAKSKELFLFEAITLLYLPNYQLIKENISKLGDIKLVQCNYSQFSSRYSNYLQGEVMPAFDPKLSGGALYDINIYNLHFVIGIFGEPKEINYTPNIGFNGIDTSGVVNMKYDNFVATCVGAKDSNSENNVMIQGADGYIKLNGAAGSCKSFDVVGRDNLDYYNENTYDNHMVDEFVAFKDMYERDDLDSCYKNLDHTLIVMKCVYKARKSGDIVFEADKI